MFVDESAIGYNAYSILKTGRDEWGRRLPLYFESFGDFKLPVYFYLTTFSILIFGLNEFSVRFLSALAGCLTILTVFFLAKKTLSSILNRRKAILAGILAALFLTFEPWHLHFSRIALEANLSLFFVVLGFYLLLKTKKIISLKGVLGYFCLLLSFFTYLAPRLFVPLLTFFLIIFSKKERKKWLVNLFIFAFLFLTVFLNPSTFSRVKGISVFHPFVRQGIEGIIHEKINEHQNFNFILRLIHNKPIEYGQRILRQYLNHFSPSFLFFKGDEFNRRFSIPFMGNLLLFELPFFLLGLYFLLENKQIILPLWFFLAPVVSSFSFQSPSSVRSVFMLPAFQIIAAVGLILFFNKINLRKKFKIFFIIFLGILFFINISYCLDNYFVHQLVHKPYYWNYGFKKVALEVKKIEANYDKIIVGKEGTPYIHFLFFQRVNPKNIWQKIERLPRDRFGFRSVKRIGRYYFDPSCPIEESDERILYICEKQVDENNFLIIDKIDYRDGALNFVLFEKKNEE